MEHLSGPAILGILSHSTKGIRYIGESTWTEEGEASTVYTG